MIFHRWGNAVDGRLERFIVVLNFSPQTQTVDISFSANGTWLDLLNDRAYDVNGFRLTDQAIESYWGRIYFQAA
jgi:pullulanase